jgi:hypothetical protein
MDKKQKKSAADKRFEAKMRALFADVKNDPDWDRVRYIGSDADKPRLKVMSEVLARQARLKIN